MAKVFFLAHNRCYKNRNVPHVTVENTQKCMSLYCVKDRYAYYSSYATFRSYVALLGAAQNQLP